MMVCLVEQGVQVTSQNFATELQSEVPSIVRPASYTQFDDAHAWSHDELDTVIHTHITQAGACMRYR